MSFQTDFTDEEIREELGRLGYHDVPQDRLEDFKRDLTKLIHSERSKTNSLNSSSTTHNEDEDKVLKEHSDENFSNHATNQWIDRGYKENWHYQGKDAFERPKTAPGCRRSHTSDDYLYHDNQYPSKFPVERNWNHTMDDVSETDSERRSMKRKTSRKTADGERSVDESFTDSDCGGLLEMYKKMNSMAMRDCECGKTGTKSGDEEPPYRLKGKNKCSGSSLIKTLEPPHTRNLETTDVFRRHQMYMKLWKTQPAIGENNRYDMRKIVHAKMMKKHSIVFDAKVYVPNVYIPPQEKRREKLRWQVRNALVKYELPQHGVYHEI